MLQSSCFMQIHRFDDEGTITIWLDFRLLSHKMENRKTAANGCCGHLPYLKDGDSCDVVTRKQVQMTSAKNLNFWTLPCEAIWRFQVNRSEDFKTHAQTALQGENSARCDCSDWCLVSSYQVLAQSDKICRLKIDSNISRSAPPQHHRGKSKNPATSELQTDVKYHSTQFQLNRPRTVGCESVWIFQEARSLREIEKSEKSGSE